VSFSVSALKSVLASDERRAGKPSRYIVAFSGGLDSTVLLHALCKGAANGDVPIITVHIDHGLQPDSADWSRHCESVAAGLGVDYRCLSVNVQLESGKGPEASAREARYTALRSVMQAGDWLLSAHHREDQAETLLLNLVRGSGPAGIAGIGAARRLGPGWLMRPLLGIERAGLQSYAETESLHWLEDPSNRDRRFDRNFLRHDIVPRLKARWPDIAMRLQRSAGHAGEAAELLTALATIDLKTLGDRPERLPVDALLQLSAARQRNVLRFALRQLGLSTPTAMQLNRVLEEVLPARPDAEPLVQWPGASVRRYRNRLYLLPEALGQRPAAMAIADRKVELGAGLGTLRFEFGTKNGLSEALFNDELRLEFRQGGEEFKPVGHRHTRKLKKLLQEEGVVPWLRDSLPLIYSGDELVAVADLWIAADAAAENGSHIQWKGRPELY
jgi:tRNA(Ile)-lysidine synthase